MEHGPTIPVVNVWVFEAEFLEGPKFVHPLRGYRPRGDEEYGVGTTTAEAWAPLAAVVVAILAAV